MHIFTATNSSRRCGFLHTSLLLALGLCQEKHYFICEKQRTGYLPVSSSLPLNSDPKQDTICPQGWYKHSNYCYKVKELEILLWWWLPCIKEHYTISSFLFVKHSLDLLNYAYHVSWYNFLFQNALSSSEKKMIEMGWVKSYLDIQSQKFVVCFVTCIGDVIF